MTSTIDFFLFLQFLQKNFPRLNTALMHGALKNNVRAELVRDFEDEDVFSANGQLLNPPAERPHILVSTTGILGTGFTCVRSFRMILLEPDFVSVTEKQAFARIRHLNQKNEMTYTY